MDGRAKQDVAATDGGAAVDLVNQARYAQQDRGRRTGRAVPGSGGESRDQPPEEHLLEP